MATRRHTSRLTATLVALLVLTHGASRTLSTQALPLATVTQEVLDRLRQLPGGPVRVLLKGDPAALALAAARLGLSPERVLDEYIVVSVDAAQVEALRLDPAVRLIAGDVRVTPLMVVSDATMRADKVRAGEPGVLGLGLPGVTGKGVGVAIVDSGIAAHAAVVGKVAAAVSFVPGDTSTGDAFGHGTHIAGIVAGQPAPARRVTALYAGGVAPGAHLVNVRVLGPDGSGYTSSVIAGLDWVLRHRIAYSIRVVNLSLGHAVVGPCLTDPLCSAVERVVRTGVVVVASAGNRGVAPSGQLVFGTITSPGNSPFALTVGALNTKGTADGNDDSVASYSSRGPAAFDLGIKPDVVAPGNRIVSLEAAGGFLATTYRAMHVAGRGQNAYATMSGTSMAAAMVSGGVALLLEASPRLTPLAAKFAVQLGAAPVDGGLMTAGAGSVDLWSARKLVGNTTTLALSSALPVASLDAGAHRLAYWDGGSLTRRLYAGTGIDVIGLRDTLVSLTDPSRLATDTLYVAGAVLPLLSGVSQMLWGAGVYAPGGQQILWGDQIYDATGQQILWGEQILWGDQILWGEQILWGDQILWGEQILWGDQILWGEGGAP